MNPISESLRSSFGGSQSGPTSSASVRIDPAHPASLAVHSCCHALRRIDSRSYFTVEEKDAQGRWPVRSWGMGTTWL